MTSICKKGDKISNTDKPVMKKSRLKLPMEKAGDLDSDYGEENGSESEDSNID